MTEIDVTKRLLDNLDTLDKSVAKTALTLFGVSLFYLALYYGVATELKVPAVKDLAVPKEIAFLAGVPLIFCLFQFSLVTSAGILQVEKELNVLTAASSFDPMIHSLRWPTVFAQLFLLTPSCKTLSRRIVLLFQMCLVFAFYYGVPLLAGAHVVRWLLENSDRWTPTIVSAALLVVCVFEVSASAIIGIRRIYAYTVNPQQMHAEATSETAPSADSEASDA